MEKDISNYHPIQDFSKYDVFAIQPGGLGQGDEELGAIGVGASVGHADPPNAIVLEFEVLIRKCLTINAYTWVRPKKEGQKQMLKANSSEKLKPVM